MSISVLPQRAERVRAVYGRLKAGTTGNLVRAIGGNRKALAGTVLLVIFAFLALFPGIVAHDNANGAPDVRPGC